MALKKALLIIAFVLFILAAFGLTIPNSNINPTAMGLALWVLTALV